MDHPKRKISTRWMAAMWLVFVAALLLLAPVARAQDNATITGSVTDASGAVVPNAALSLENPATGQTRETKSNESGGFRFANVGVGTYTLTATAAGFQKSTRTGIVVNVAQTVAADMMLTVGSAEQSVTVEAQALQVQTETSEISTLISGEQVRQLATNGRNVVQLAALGMGVSNQLASFGGIDALTSSNAISFNGQRVAHNVYLIDGAEQNDRGCGGCFMNLPSQDAVGEFQTLGSNYAADYGIGSGGTVTMVIKSGQRDFHGSLYEFNRNTAYNANDYFLKRSTPPKSRPIFQLNTPGGNIGGPLWIPHVYNEQKNRTFFFWNEEWRKMIKGTVPSITNDLWTNNFPTLGADLNYTPQSSTIPLVPSVPGNPAFTALETSLGLTPGAAFPKNEDGTYRIPAAMIDQNIVRELNAGTFPKPNYNCTGAVCKQFIVSVKQPENIREDVVRIDHAINSKLQLMGHYLHDAMENTFYPPLWAGSFATVGTAMKNPSYTAAIKLTQTYSPSLLNETAFFYSGNKIRLSPLAGPGASYSFPSGWTANSLFPSDNQAAITHGLKNPIMPAITTSGTLSATWNPSYFPWKNGYEGFQYRDDLSWTKGRHQFKFGVGLLHTYKNQELQANTNGTATFNTDAFSKDSIVNMMLGMAAGFNQLEYLWGKHWVNNNYSFYAIDNWHVSPRLTLNLGLRYDGLPHAFERYNKFANFVPSSYSKTLGNPIQTDNTLNPGQLTKYGNGNFYLNGIHEAGVNGFPKGNVENRYFTWQPRIGFAFDMFGGGKTVLRGGVGVFYERVQGNDVYNSALNPPFAYQPAPANVFFSNPSMSVNTGVTGTSLFPSGLTSIRYIYPPPGTMNFSLGIQHQLMPSVVAAVQYVGSSGWDQNNTRQINTLPLTNDPSNVYSTVNGNWAFTAPTDPNWNPTYADRYAVRSGQIVANKLRQYPGFANINQEENQTNAHYHSLQSGVRFEEKWGLTTQVAYTYSHLLDSAPGTGDLQTLNNPFNPAYSRGSGSYDRRHIFNMSYVYMLPFAKHSSNMVYKTIVGGWGISGITVFQTGNPLQILYNGGDTLGLGGGTSNRPNLVGKIKYPKQVLSWFNNGQNGNDNPYADPVAPWFGGPNNGFGSAGKDNVRGPGLHNWNLSLLKHIQLTGSDNGPRIELRFESFNTFNKAQFSGVNANNHDGNFGQVTSVYSNRVLELGGKFRF